LCESQHRWDVPAVVRLALIFGLGITVAAIYWPSAAALNAIWTGSAGNTYTHGYLVLAAGIWLTVRDRTRLAAMPIIPDRWGWALVVLLSGAWVWAWRTAIQELHVLLLPAIVLAALLAAFGWRIARMLLVPVGMVFFAMPIWGAINGGLQTLSASVNGVLIWLSGLPAYMQGSLIRLPAGTIEIAQTCTGLNSLVIGLSVAALYGELARDPFRRRLLWLGIMGTLALIANALRIFIVTVVAYKSDMRSSLVTHHIWLGWCLFVVATGAFLLTAGHLADSWDRRRPRKRGLEAVRPAEAALEPCTRGARAANLAITLICVGLLPTLVYGTHLSRSRSHTEVTIQWPSAPAGWHGPASDGMSDWSPLFVNASAQSIRRYVDSGMQPVEVFAVAYGNQTQNSKLLAYGNDLFRGMRSLRPESQRIIDSSAGKWRETLAVDPAGTASLIWWRYRIRDRVFVRPYSSQLWYGFAAIADEPLSSLTALRAVCRPDCSAARGRLAVAAARLQPALSSARFPMSVARRRRVDQASAPSATTKRPRVPGSDTVLGGDEGEPIHTSPESLKPPFAEKSAIDPPEPEMLSNSPVPPVMLKSSVPQPDK